MFCILCKSEIDGGRARRGAVTCSDKCAREVSRQRRQAVAEKKCRLCGRRFRNRKPVGAVSKNTDSTANEAQESLGEAVRDAHNGISEVGQTGA
jgi:hypothetical protein